MEEYFAVFLIGILGGFSHCIGMCGGFVMTYSLKLTDNISNNNKSFWQKFFPHLLFNGGRVFTYTILGEIFGILGSTLGFILAFRNFQGGLMLFAGIIMIVMGLDFAGFLPAHKPDTFPGINKFKNLVQSLFRRVNHRNLFGLGFVLGFLPCGMVYAIGAKAAATQSIIGGGLTMLFFGLGTLPAMILTGLTAHLISNKLRNRLYKIAAILIIILGIVTVVKSFKSIGLITF